MILPSQSVTNPVAVTSVSHEVGSISQIIAIRTSKEQFIPNSEP
jgi:putative effector of murein hydrolase